MKLEQATVHRTMILLRAIAAEMDSLLGQASFSQNLSERREFCSGIFNAQGELIAHGAGGAMGLGALHFAVQLHLQRLKTCRETLLLNDPYAGGTAPGDIVMITPWFREEQRSAAFFLATRTCHVDLGGREHQAITLAGKIADEGVLVRPVEFTQKGQVSRKVLTYLGNSVGAVEHLLPDLSVQLAANQRAAERLAALHGLLGVSALDAVCAAVLAEQEQRMISFLEELPKVEASHEDFLDDDGYGNRDLLLRCTSRVEPGCLAFDFSQCADQVTGPLNAAPAVTHAAVFALCNALQRNSALSSVLLKRVAVTVRSGSILQPKAPAAVSAGYRITGQRVIDLLLGLAQIWVPEKVPACSGGSGATVCFTGSDSKLKRNYSTLESVGEGGGASAASSGSTGVLGMFTDGRSLGVENLELQYPVRVERLEIRTGSSGEGFMRGGNGVNFDFTADEDMQIGIWVDRQRHAPRGHQGGGNAQMAEVLHLNAQGPERIYGKAVLALHSGEGIVISTPGGAGYGKATDAADR